MDRPTDHLMEDHVVAARGVRCLSAMAQQLRDGGAFPADDVSAVVRFLRDWVVEVHMRKEDDLIGPSVAMRADDRAAALVGVLFRLREEIAELLRSLELFLEPLGERTDEEQRGFLAAVDALVDRLKQRQDLEEEHLFPACNRFVGADDQLSWLGAFQELEVEHGGRDDWSGQIDALASRWLAPSCE